MVFGIDLGTTNSLIGAGDILYTGLVSSNVDISESKQVGRDVYGDNIIASYKTDMGMSDSAQPAVFCSSVVLKALANMAKRRSGEEVKDVCISVPAYFATTQREAVKKAAEMAGLNLKRIVNEPTAAAIYVCRDIRDFVVVYDLGGGTFDVTIIDTRDGVYRTIATDGEVLGGDDLDEALCKYLLDKYKVRMLYRKAANLNRLKVSVRLAKEHIQKTGENAFVDFSYLGKTEDAELTVDEYKKLTEEVFGPTITKTMALLDKYVPSYENPKIIYTGGSTYCPYLMELLDSELGLEKLEYMADKDKLVAHGIAYIAELVKNGEDSQFITNVTKRLSIEHDDGSTIQVIEENTIIPCTVRMPLVNVIDTDKLMIRLYQGNAYMAKDNDYIGTLEYHYGTNVSEGEGLVNLDVTVSYDGVVTLKVFGLTEDESQAQDVKLTLR